MMKRLALSTCGALSLAIGLGMATLTQVETEAAGPATCNVYNATTAWNYPSTFLGNRNDSDSWTHYMSQHDCTSNLAQVRVKQWGAELCDIHNAGFVILTWQWQYDDGNFSYGNLQQQYDCDDLP